MSNHRSRHERVALVTGSTSGIGLAIAQALILDGWMVALHGLGTAQEIDSVLMQVASQVGFSNMPRHFHADLRSPEQARGLVSEVESKLGRVDLLVNNAGVQHTSRVEDFPTSKWDEIMAINLSAVFHACAAALPGMKRRNFGRIVNIASIHGLVASAEKAAYVSAKHGVVGLTKTIALENARSNITCNAICPGWVRTPLVEAQVLHRMSAMGLDHEAAERTLLAEKEPSQRFTATEHIASAVVFLISEAGSNITGTSLAMDGAWTAQ